MQLKEEKWLAQVTNPNTGEFVQPEQLKAAGWYQMIIATTKNIQ